MAALENESYRRWEEEVREASCRGLEGILPPAAQWPSFLLASAPRDAGAEGLDFPSPGSLDALLEREMPSPEAPPAGPSATVSQAPRAGAAGTPTAQAGSGPLQELPESKLPESLRAEIEEFLDQDRPAPATDDEVKAYLKGGIDPNVEPEEK